MATRGGSGLNLFLLEARRPGITVLPMEAMAGDRPCEVSFADVVLRGEDTLGAPGRGWEMLRPALQAGALARAVSTSLRRSAQAVARKGHQLLGAISFCEEHSLHLFHKRIVAAALDFGDPSHHLETVASAMGLA